MNSMPSRKNQVGLTLIEFMVSIVIGMLMIALYLKLRQLEETAGDQAETGVHPVAEEHTFFPRGAIFFFVLLVILYAVIWLVIYGLMIARS